MITKAQHQRIKAYAKTPKADQALFFVKGIPNAGVYWFLPVVGWVEWRNKSHNLMLSGTLLRIANQESVGTGTWRIPATEVNLVPLLNVLAALGWSGGLWPLDGGYPTGFPEERGLRTLMGGVPILNTISLPPDPEKGNRVIRVVVSKSTGWSPLPLDLEESERVPVPQAAYDRFEEMLDQPELFMPEGWDQARYAVEGQDF